MGSHLERILSMNGEDLRMDIHRELLRLTRRAYVQRMTVQMEILYIPRVLTTRNSTSDTHTFSNGVSLKIRQTDRFYRYLTFCWMSSDGLYNDVCYFLGTGTKFQTSPSCDEMPDDGREFNGGVVSTGTYFVGAPRHSQRAHSTHSSSIRETHDVADGGFVHPTSIDDPQQHQ